MPLTTAISSKLPLTAVKWLVVGVVVYTAIAMLHSAARETKRQGKVANG